MVKCQLYTLEHLMNSRFGLPFPRHGLQLLFWFANNCVTFEPLDCVFIMKLTSHCQPEKGCYGFHLFGNMEELLPVLERPRKRNSKRKALYFEVGNLNTETYPASADLPQYVSENYGLDGCYGDSNIDRIIISYQLRTRLVETVYVTEHDPATLGQFSRERTYQISSELMQILQNQQLDLNTFLYQMGYSGYTQAVQDNQMEVMGYQQMSNMVQNHSDYVSTANQDVNIAISGHFNQNAYAQVWNSYDQQVSYTTNMAYNNRSRSAHYSEVHDKYWWSEAVKARRALQQSYWQHKWTLPYYGFDDGSKKGSSGGGSSLVKLLLGVGALWLAAKCFFWLRSCWNEDLNKDLSQNILRSIPWRSPAYRHTHIMLDYVY